MYVDDSTVGVVSVEEGIEFFKFSKMAMKEGGFELRKWCTKRYIIEDEGAVETKLDESPMQNPHLFQRQMI